MRSLRSASLVAAALLAACAAPPTPPGEVAASTKQRVTTPAPSTDLDATVTGNTEFAVDIYKALSSKPDNVVFSPTSIDVALAMTYAGAKTTTATAFEHTLHVSTSADRFHRAMNTIDAALASRGAGASGKDGKPFRLSVLNQVFSQRGFSLEANFLDVLAAEYGANVRLLDFIAAAEPSRLAINRWVEGNTEGLIPELLPKGSITSDTRLTLVNTVYFNAAWKKKFDPNDTHPGAFTLRDGSTKNVPMMAAMGLDGAHALVGGTDVIELPYDGGEVSMVLLVPAKGSFDAFEQSLSAGELHRHIAALQAGQVNVSMPKFDFKTQTSLSETLTALGLGIAFSDTADFSGMTKDAHLSISDVVHEAVIKTDEAGTEAAAATGVIIGVTSVPSYIMVDRPFVFLIRDVPTGSVVFMGRVVSP